MRTLAAGTLLALLGGCWYDGPNPWDTSGDVADLEKKEQDDLQLAMLEVWPEPRVQPDPMTDPKLEAWSRTVLPFAGRETLEAAEAQSKRKMTDLDARIRSLMRHDELSRRETLTPLVWAYVIERQRLKLLGERLGSLGRG